MDLETKTQNEAPKKEQKTSFLGNYLDRAREGWGVNPLELKKTPLEEYQNPQKELSYKA